VKVKEKIKETMTRVIRETTFALTVG